MKKIAAAEACPTALFLLYGQGKMYKTSTMLAIPPELRPCAFLDTDLGAALRLKVLTMSAADRERAGVVEQVPEHFGPWMREGLDIYQPDPKRYYGDLWDFATKIVPEGGYKSVVVDAISRMSRSILEEVKSTEYGGGKRLRVGDGGAQTIQPTMGDYGLAQTRIMEFIQAINESPAHAFLVSHEKTGEVRDTDAVKRVIGGPSSVGTALLEILPAVVDVVVRLEPQAYRYVENGKQKLGNKVVMRTKNHNFFLAGDRSGLFEDGEELDPKRFWDKVLATIQLAGADASTTEERP